MKRWQDQIKYLVKADRKEHTIATKSGDWTQWKERARENAMILKKIVRKHGWPTVSTVGKRVSHDAWFIAQHSDADQDFQQTVLKAMKDSFAKNQKDVLKENIAFLEDRVLVNRGRKQLYGSQFYVNKKGELVPRPIRDLARLDQRRKDYHLPPFNEYLESAKEYSSKRSGE